jgi:hypothetical protein
LLGDKTGTVDLLRLGLVKVKLLYGLENIEVVGGKALLPDLITHLQACLIRKLIR